MSDTKTERKKLP